MKAVSQIQTGVTVKFTPWWLKTGLQKLKHWGENPDKNTKTKKQTNKQTITSQTKLVIMMKPYITIIIYCKTVNFCAAHQ